MARFEQSFVAFISAQSLVGVVFDGVVSLASVDVVCRGVRNDARLDELIFTA